MGKRLFAGLGGATVPMAVLAGVLTAAVSGCGGGATASSGPVQGGPIVAPGALATVDASTTYQTIRGFGGSSAWISNFSPAQADTLFGTGSGQLGLSLLRVRIDPGGQANWGTELNNAQLASSRGASVVATPWTPPASMKSNNNTVGGTLNVASYGAYASYLESFVSYMQGGGVSLYAISMQNEPDAQVNYESCGWTGTQMDAWIASSAGTLTTRLMMPESEGFNPALSDPALNDPAAVGMVGIVAGHIYGTTPQSYPNATAKGKEVWMTEHYLTDTGITGALELAKEVHDGMTTAGYSAYLWWWIENYSGGNYGNGLMDANHNATLNGYALAQFARFVRPGYQRVSATANPGASVYVSAYAGSGHLVIVALNLGTTAVSQPFAGLNANPSGFTPYQTTANGGLVVQPAVSVANGGFTATLPANSVTTFVE